jgi:hypothetical protein
MVVLSRIPPAKTLIPVANEKRGGHEITVMKYYRYLFNSIFVRN